MIEIGAIVAAKRSEKGVGQNELARRADMSPSQLCLLEKDRVSPTVRTLERIAEALGISFWDLVAEPPREGAQGGAPRAATRLGDYVALRLGEPWAGKALNDILPREREISSIEDGKGVDSACRLLLKYPKGKLEGAGAAIAGAARASLGIGTAPYCDLAGCLDFNGVRIHKIPLSYQVQSAAYWNTERKTFSIILSAANTPERDLYRLAWELGSICIFSSLGFVPFEETHAYHRFLTDFSAELLMPAVTVQSFSASTGIARNGWTLETVCALKAKFGVSAETFALRLDELGLIDPAVRIGIRDALRAHYVSHPDEMEPAPRLAPLNIASRVQILGAAQSVCPAGKGDHAMNTGIYAHSRRDLPIDKWQTLQVHCSGVARLCSRFADAFGSGAPGAVAGRVHDLGKSRASFQSYLRRCNGIEEPDPDFGDRVHASAGGIWLWHHFESLGKALAYCVAGHHAGLPDWSGGTTPDGALATLLKHDALILKESTVSKWIARHEAEWLDERLSPPFKFSRDDSSLSFWIRMMYSCLVDADFLDTEAFMGPERAALRQSAVSLGTLANIFFAKLDDKQRSAADTSVNHIRAEIREACERAASLAPGLFSLTVPTGGGKTLSGTAFALRHSLMHGMKRIIYVIPYTSIIEQTADVLREFFGAENVLEHHSNFDTEKETPQSRLASENWDAPVVVTTAVQFFESLYACKSSRCRKLHNIAESVVVLDEVQLLPSRLLLPCAEAIRQLVRHYKTTIVLSTATQLDLPGIDAASIREMVPAALDLYKRLKRTDIEYPPDIKTRRTWDEIADELRQYDQVLCIVNTRRDCYDLYGKMPEGAIHLSAGMCGEHRSRVISEIKRRLSDNDPIRVVSTQLVEAGVDIDFPIVYRAFAGLSSVAQSAGRCNREGRLESTGRVVVFMPPNESPVKDLRDGEYAMSDLLACSGGVDADDANSYRKYFKILHGRANDMGVAFEKLLGIPVPKELLAGARQRAEPLKYQFREAASAFKMIDGALQVPVIVRYGGSDALIESLRTAGPKRGIMRSLQRYTVNVPRGRLGELIEKGMIEEMQVLPLHKEHSGLFVQTAPSAYREDIGFDLFGEGIKPEDFIV